MKKRLLSLLLALTMIVSLVPGIAITASAAGAADPVLPSLPEGYTAVPYLVTDGSEAIHTGIMNNEYTDPVIEMRFFVDRAAYDNTERIIIGGKLEVGKSLTRLTFNNSAIKFRMNEPARASLPTATVEMITNKWNTFKLSRNGILFDGKSIQYSALNGSSTSDEEIVLFNDNDTSTNGLIGAISYVKMWNGEDLIRNYVPCVRNSDSEPGMFDLVNNEFAANAHEGTEFTCPESIVCDYTLGDTTGTKYTLPKSKLGKNNPVTWTVYAPEDGTYAFNVGFGWSKGTNFAFTGTFTPFDYGKEIKTFSVSCQTVIDWSGYYAIGYVELEKGLYSFSLNQTSSTTGDVQKPYEVPASTGVYDVKYYIDDVFHSIVQQYGTLGQSTEAVGNSSIKGFQMLPITQQTISKDNSDEVRVDYITPKYPAIIVDSEKIEAVKADSTLYWFLPYTMDLSAVSIEATADTTLTIGDAPVVLTANESQMLNLSGNPTITCTCEAQDLDTVPVVIMNSENLDALCLDISRPLDTITKADSTAATGSISLISAADGTVTVIDSDEDPETPEITEFLKRGSSSYSNANGKYSYKFKLDAKYPLVKNEIGEEVKGKNWVLVANNSQEYTGFGNAAAYSMYQDLGGDNAVSFRFVNLYIGGKYQGVYMLAEQAKAQAKKTITISDDPVLKTDHSVKIDSTNGRNSISMPEFSAKYNGGSAHHSMNAWVEDERTGFILEISHTESDSGSLTTSRGQFYFFKEPEFLTYNQSEKILVFIQDMEDALFSENGFNAKGKHYSEYIDIDSFAKAFIVKMFQNDGDWFANSTYLAIDCDEEGNLLPAKSGNIWDCSGTPSGSNIYDGSSWCDIADQYYEAFLSKGDFVAKIYEYLPEFMEIAAAKGEDLSAMYAEMTPAMAMNKILYNRNFSVNGPAFITSFSNRINTWNAGWSDETNALRGVTVASVGGTLTATAPGATEYQWYKVGEDGYTGIEINGETAASYTPDVDGTYYVVAKGTALSGIPCSDTMCSNPVYASATYTTTLTKVEDSKAEYGENDTFAVELTVGHSDPSVTTWNAASFEVTYNADDLEFVSGTETLGGQTVSYDDQNGTLYIDVFGPDKAFTDTITLTFKDINDTLTEDTDTNVVLSAAEITTTGGADAEAATITDGTVTVTLVPSEYTVTWKSQDGETTIETDEEVSYGSAPSFDSAAPTKDADAQYTYTFAGWATEANAEEGKTVDALDAVTDNVTYYAAFSKTAKTFTVTWKSQDGETTIETDEEVSYGSAPSFDSAAPTKDADAQYTYTFAGWATEANAETALETLPAVTDNVTYYAAFSKTAKTFTVTWKSQDGETTIETDENVAYNAAPSFDSAAPTKDADAQYTYTFAGWATEANAETGIAAGELTAVTADATYYAAFSKEANEYTLTTKYVYADGTKAADDTTADVAFGAAITDATLANHEFVAWDGDVSTMPAENTEVTAIVKFTGFTVTVGEYVTYSEEVGKTMYKVDVKLNDEVALADGAVFFYGDSEDAMFINADGTYSWLIVVENDAYATEDAMLEAVKAEISVKGGEAQTYNDPSDDTSKHNVNMSTKVDISDAQLAYDISRGLYEDFTVVSMAKFLNANLPSPADGKVTVADAQAVVSYIVAARTAK